MIRSRDSTRIRCHISLVPRPHPQKEEEGLVTFERFLGSCKLSILTFAKANQIAAPRFSCDLASGRAATIVQCLAGGLALANENAVSLIVRCIA